MIGSRWRVDVFLAPGELTVHATPTNVKTIVGSCVAVCLWDRRRRTGGVNHYLLPCPGAADVPDARFGSVATTQLIERMCRIGGDREHLDASVIGGGHPVQAVKGSALGDDNVRVALAVLRDAAIKIVRQKTGGDHGRKLLFNTHTGELIVRDLRGWPDATRTEAKA